MCVGIPHDLLLYCGWVNIISDDSRSADKKKNGLKSSLVKCYIERITEDPYQLLEQDVAADDGLHCPACGSRFARPASIHGRPALKMAGGKVRMSKK